MKSLRLIPWTAGMAAMLLAVTSCDDWGKKDPPAGNQVTPTLENIASYGFDAEEGLDPTVFTLKSNSSGALPQIVEDEEKGDVLCLNNGYVAMENPFTKVKLQNAASFTFWIKQPESILTDEEGNESVEPLDINSPLITFENETGNARLYITANGCISYSAADGEWIENDPGQYSTGYLTRGRWHYVAVILGTNGYEWYVDGNRKVSKTVPEFEYSKVVAFANNAPKMSIGAYDNNTPWLIDDLTLYRNTITSKEIVVPSIGGGGGNTPGGDVSDFFPVEPIYFNSFDAGLGGCTLMGDGEFLYVGGAFGTVFKNAVGGMRENYLLLPQNALAKVAETEELTISVWVNSKDAGDYFWNPIFTAYGDMPGGDGCPMFACQYRGVVSVNTGADDDHTINDGIHYCDYIDAQCDQGTVTLYHGELDWLADQEWHLYTAVFTTTSAAVYFDGKVANSWTLDGTSAGQICDLKTVAAMKCICLGGNQAWGWADPDPGFAFDDLAIFNKALTQNEIQTIMDLKTNVIYGNTFSNGADNMTLMGGGEFIESDTPGFGKVFKNAVGGMRENYLLLPQNALSRVAETEELTISVWLNSTDAGDYFWNPVFTAYGDMPGGDGCPMFACQYRGVVSVNTGADEDHTINDGIHYCDYVDAQCDQGTVTLYHGDLDWLADKEWHLYTAVFTPTSAAVYFDGEIANSWTLDGTSAGQICDLKTVAAMKCICLGGNQAWGWGDPDPGFAFDDIFIYNKALTQNEVKQLVLMKK